MHKNYKTQETGRSMVEMLGVLAVIGVLSVGGVVGYSTAMNKYKANKIIDALTERAVAISDQLTRNPTGTADMGEFSEKIAGCEKCGFEVESFPEAEVFKISVSKLPREICQQILAQISETSLIRKINPTSCNNDLNMIDFYFTNDLSDDTIEVEFSASDYKTESDCKFAGNKWCSFNSQCRETDCLTPSTYNGNKSSCETAGYVYYYQAPGSTMTPHACSPYELPAGDHRCYNGKTFLKVESSEYCPNEKYKTKASCESAGFYWCECSGCIVGRGCELC